MKPRQSLSGFIRQHLDSLEAQLYAGIRQDVIVEELAQKGFITTVPIFRTLLHRARIRAASAKVRPPVLPRPELVQPDHSPLEKSGLPAKPQVEAKPPNPLTKPAGFEYGGKVDPSDLI